jgi:hypothetical protein
MPAFLSSLEKTEEICVSASCIRYEQLLQLAKVERDDVTIAGGNTGGQVSGFCPRSLTKVSHDIVGQRSSILGSSSGQGTKREKATDGHMGGHFPEMEYSGNH